MAFFNPNWCRSWIYPGSTLIRDGSVNHILIGVFSMKALFKLRVIVAGVVASAMADLPPINHLQSVRIKLLTIGEIHEDPKTAVHT
jgi:hypothetical protein